MRRKIIAVDVDQTVVRSDLHWKKYLEINSSFDKDLFNRHKRENYVHYDLSKYSENFHHPVDNSPFDFWRNSHAYCDMKPIEGSVEALEALSKDFDIIFVSALKGDHHKSKFYFLRKYFPFMKGFLGTKEKGYVLKDYFIDDRNKFLNSEINENVKLIKYETFYGQCENLKNDIWLETSNWQEIAEKILKENS